MTAATSGDATAAHMLDLEPTHDYAEPIDMGRYA